MRNFISQVLARSVALGAEIVDSYANPSGAYWDASFLFDSEEVEAFPGAVLGISAHSPYPLEEEELSALLSHGVRDRRTAG